MKYFPPLSSARLIKRYKRFLADIELAPDLVRTIHCPNTGSMKHCADPGSRIWYSTSDNPKRKYAETFELVQTFDGSIAGVNTHKANHLVREGIENGVINELSDYAEIKAEVRYGEEKSRVDFVLSGHTRKSDCYVEVKSVTLGVGEGLGLFPDAVTERGTRHLRELIKVHEQGARAVLFFCVQHTGISRVEAAKDIDPEYSETLLKAQQAGVEIMAYKANISPHENVLVESIPVVLDT